MATDEGTRSLVERLAAIAGSGELSVAVAESLTGGQLSAALSAGPEASRWFRGGVVAYHPDVKFCLLEVPPGPVVTRSCAEQMARAAAQLTGARVAVALTGVGGPDPEEGQPPGTVWLAVCVDGGARAEQHHFDGEPAEVLDAAVTRSVEVLVDICAELGRTSPADG
jgi:nicotinamide-nucleotide amidase